MIEVAAAVLVRPDGAFLLAQRPAGKVYAGYWEFPGGKIEPGEAADAALARELHEELGIDVVTAYPWITREHVYEHGHVRLNFFRVTEWTGEPHPRVLRVDREVSRVEGPRAPLDGGGVSERGVEVVAERVERRERRAARPRPAHPLDDELARVAAAPGSRRDGDPGRNRRTQPRSRGISGPRSL